jgi:hypothetical protein
MYTVSVLDPEFSVNADPDPALNPALKIKCVLMLIRFLVQINKIP